MSEWWLRGTLAAPASVLPRSAAAAPAVHAQSDWCMSSVGPMNGCQENYFNQSHDVATGTIVVPDLPQQPRLANTQDVSQASPGEDEQPGGHE